MNSHHRHVAWATGKGATTTTMTGYIDDDAGDDDPPWRQGDRDARNGDDNADAPIARFVRETASGVLQPVAITDCILQSWVVTAALHAPASAARWSAALGPEKQQNTTRSNSPPATASRTVATAIPAARSAGKP
jgi:hypothetical protein